MFERIDHYDIPMVALRGMIAFPNSIINFEVSRDISIKAVDHAFKNNEYLFLTAQRNFRVESPSIRDVYKTGVLCKINHVIKTQNGGFRVLAKGIARARIDDSAFTDHFTVHVHECEEIPMEPDMEESYMRSLLDTYQDYLDATERNQDDSLLAYQDIKRPEELVDTLSLIFVQDLKEKQDLLETLSVEERYKKLITLIEKEINIYSTEQEIFKTTRGRIDKTQREAFLREQMRTIQQSLGEEDSQELTKYREFIENMPASRETKDKLLKEVDRMEKMSPQYPDYSVLENYFEWITSLPYGKYSEDRVDIKEVKKALDNDHYGMDKVKDRILEYLSVFQLTGNVQGNILCFVGPPGVGKTSIASSIARAIGRKFVRMSLGGVRDEAEIRGHRRTYIGAVPGRIIANIRRAGTMNPVFLLDEIDKMASDYKGDPTSAMLEVLDESVNKTFQDHYLDIDFDLSRVMFICTANNAEDIPAPLYDRMEIIELDSYTPYEKEKIAIKHLIPKELEKNGLNKDILKIQPAAIRDIIRYYTVESGVRSLEREIGIICRKVARQYIENKGSFTVTKKDLEKYLGKQKNFDTKLPDKATVGVAVGLAWTYGGGSTLPVEVSAVKGSGQIELTGQLGDVMKESAKTAISYVRSIAKDFEIDPEFYKELDIHLHVPEGAVPKDGPSAGVTMALAVVSALKKKKIRRDIAMTGEITLIGRVLAIGGLREKTFAAYRAGIRNVIIPKDNLRDLDDIPKEIRDKMTFFPVENAEEVIRLGLSTGKLDADKKG